MDEDDLRQRTGEIGKQLVAILDLLVTLTDRIEQPVDGPRNFGNATAAPL